MIAPDQAPPESQDRPRPWIRIAARVLLHFGFLLIAIACLALYEHLRVSGSHAAAWGTLAAAAAFGFAPARDAVRVVFRVEGKALHLIHVIGGLGLLILPLTGAVSGAPVLSHAAMAPFAIMGAAQAIMHQHRPRNARQAAALQRFAASLPEVARFTEASDLTSPANARRAVTVLSDIVARAEALGETELDADPGFQGALSQATARFGANLGLDAVELSLRNLATNPTTAGAVPALRRQLATARRTVAGVQRPSGSP